jgi:hypothetical protein
MKLPVFFLITEPLNFAKPLRNTLSYKLIAECINSGIVVHNNVYEKIYVDTNVVVDSGFDSINNERVLGIVNEN